MVANRRTCKICKKKFIPIQQMQPTCFDMQCQIDYANKHLKKQGIEAKKESRRALKQFNNSDVNVLKRKAQQICNEYIRIRDIKEPCISCLYSGDGRQWHAGHYKPQGGNSLLRYDERNIHKQCSICNNHKSGNLVPYRNNLIKKIGLTTVEELESMNTTKSWTIEELQIIIHEYKFKVKNLKDGLSAR